MKKDHSNIITLPLDALIERLTLAGYEVSPRQRLQLWRVLQQFGTDALQEPTQLKYRLAPLIATNAAEQEHFYQIFDKYLEDIQQYEPKAEEENPLRWWERIPTWAWAALLLLGLAALITGLWYWLDQKETPILQATHPRSVTIGASFTAQNGSTGYDSTTTSFRWELCDAETKKVEQSNEEHSDHWELTITEQGNSPDKILRLIARVGEERDTFRSSLQVKCADPPNYSAIVETKPADTSRTVSFRLEGTLKDNLAYEWDFGDGNSSEGYPVAHTYQKEGAYEVKLNISRPDAEGYCRQQLSKRISIGQKEYAFLSFKKLLADQPDRTAHFSTGTWLLMALIALLALYFWYRWLQQKPPPPDPERKARALQARFAHADRGPYQIPFRPQDDALRPGAELYRLAQVLRLRQEGLRTVLDVPATIKNTIEQGGFPAVHLRRTTLPPNYLFLIDEQAPHSHQAQLYRYLLDFLRGQDVHIAAFWYKKTPARFWNAQYPKGLSLEQLQRLYPHYRLLVLGDAHAMLDPLAREQHQVQPELAANLRRWKSRLLLTPLPANDWTYREAAIYDQMAVFPSDTAGVESAMAYLEAEHDEEDQRAMPSFTNWQSAHSQPPLPPETNYQKWSRPKTYDHYFAGRADLYRWFRALMVYPSPTWPLTLAIGKAIGAPLHFDNLLLLSRLPYLQGKPIPHRLRMQLLSKLDEETVQQARAAVAEELEAAAPAAKNSHANRQLQTQLAMQQFMLQPEEEQYREAIRHLLDANALNKRDRAELEEGLQQQKGGEVQLERFLSGKEQEAVLAKARRPLNTDFKWAVSLSILLFILSMLVGLLDGTDRFNNILQQPGEEEATSSADSQQVAFWNARVLNSLRKARVSIDARIEWLQENGQDPHQEKDFPKLANEQKQLIKSYREALIDYKVESKKTDVIVIDKFVDVFKTVKELEKFMELYQAYNEAIKRRLPEAKNEDWFFISFEEKLDSAMFFNNKAVVKWDSLREQKAVPRPGDLEAIGNDLQRANQYRNGNYPLAAANAARNDYHRGLLHYHKYLQNRDTLSAATASLYFERVRESDSLQADGMHALGLLAYYQEDNTEATGYYNGLLAQGYFDTLKLQPNLRSLLFRTEGNAVQSNCLPPPAFEILGGDTLCLGDSLRLRINRDKGNIDYYLVRWGDGQADTLSQPGEISHVYRLLSGEIPVSVLSFGSCRGEPEVYNIRTELIVLQSPPDEISDGIRTSNTTGCAPLQVEFSVDTVAAAGIEYNWNLGVGTSSEPQPSITYTQPGEYRVSLRLSNGCGEVQAQQVIRVLSPEECLASITIPGRVVDVDSGEPIAYAFIVAGDANRTTDEQLRAGQFAYSATADEKGQFELGGVPKGTRQLQVLVRAEGYENVLIRHRPGKEPIVARMEWLNPNIPGKGKIDKDQGDNNTPIGRIIYVAENSKGKGTSWKDAMGDLQTALRQSSAGDQIWVAAGTYYAAEGNDRNKSFMIKNGVQVYGGFAGNESSINQRNLQANFTILSGEAGQVGNAFDNAYTVVTIKQASSSTVLNGLVIEKGGALGTEGTEQGFGAGLVNDGSNGSSNPLIEYCIFRNNLALEGAALYNFAQGGNCSPTIKNCQFVSNEAYLNGGAIFNRSSDGTCNPIIENCLFENNKAVYGGAIFNQAESGGTTIPQIRECRFVDNVVTKRGRSVYNESISSGFAEPVLIGTIHERSYLLPVMVQVEGGTFTMGCLNEKRDGECQEDEKPYHEVTISTFYMSAHEVTNEEFMMFLNAEGNQEEGGKAWYDAKDSRSRLKRVKNGYKVDPGYEQHPVTHVSWYAARAYARWLSEQAGQNYRLPTEAEWEYAARGGKNWNKAQYLYSGNNNIDAVAWYKGNSEGNTHPVGQKNPNQLGLNDMSGNVWEWVQDCWHEDYKGAPDDGSAWLESNGGDCDRPVLRGGSWDDVARDCRIVNRGWYYSDNRSDYGLGFRLARD